MVAGMLTADSFNCTDNETGTSERLQNTLILCALHADNLNHGPGTNSTNKHWYDEKADISRYFLAT